MDVRNQSRERVFSILNDNDCPSFVIRSRQSSSPQTTAPSLSNSPRQERPSLYRYSQYKRNSSFSSTGSSPPTLHRFDSSSSKSSNSSMDSSPSPITPAYQFGDPSSLGYDNVLRQDLTGYMPSPSTITPFMENQLMIAPTLTDPFAQKALLPQPMSQYPILPAPSHTDIPQLPTPVSSNNSAAASVSKTSPANSNAAPPTGKKNKYPCPYSMSHNCSATFTTSGHAARHGKKHTGEKGVHCPICNKAFTRKDNMKQHERTHKNHPGNDSSLRRSKAAASRDSQRNKQLKKEESDATSSTDLLSSSSSTFKRSPVSDQTSIEPPPSELPMLMPDSTPFYTDNNPMLLQQPPLPDTFSSNTIYPPLTDEALLNMNNMLPSALDARLAPLGSGNIPMPPSLVRGFSDLDTLAQAAESFDPAYQQPIQSL